MPRALSTPIVVSGNDDASNFDPTLQRGANGRILLVEQRFALDVFLLVRHDLVFDGLAGILDRHAFGSHHELNCIDNSAGADSLGSDVLAIPAVVVVGQDECIVDGAESMSNRAQFCILKLHVHTKASHGPERTVLNIVSQTMFKVSVFSQVQIHTPCRHSRGGKPSIYPGQRFPPHCGAPLWPATSSGTSRP